MIGRAISDGGLRYVVSVICLDQQTTELETAEAVERHLDLDRSWSGQGVHFDRGDRGDSES